MRHSGNIGPENRGSGHLNSAFAGSFTASLVEPPVLSLAHYHRLSLNREGRQGGQGMYCSRSAMNDEDNFGAEMNGVEACAVFWC